MTTGWKLLIGVALIAGAALGGYWKGHHDEAQVYALFRSQQAAAAAQLLASNQHAVAALAASDAAAMQATTTQLQENVNDLTQRRDALVASRDQLARELQQRIAATRATSALVSRSAAGACGGDGAGDASLSDGLEQLVDFNNREFYEADHDAAQLTAAQQVITQDRLVCNGKLPGVSP